MTINVRGLLIGLTVLLFFIALCARCALALSEVVVVTQSGQHVFFVEIADTPEQRSKGLMYRHSLGSDRGMLFDFGRAAMASMWMKNTYISLDIIFIDPNGRIVNIEADTVPQSLHTISSLEPVRAVLELNAGITARITARPGDKVIHPIFASD
tara:strand:- start:414 stop:875 length:462 start_codon:yes stop_codon:yes gene_type:complete